MEEAQYELKLENRSDLGRDIYKFITADGVASKNSFRIPELALADNVTPETDDSILVAQAGFGFLGVLMADKTPEDTVEYLSRGIAAMTTLADLKEALE